ncbi:hypothetical protein [Lentilactobacillus farraginis]|uniref:Uncharacterized protein n=1 Tax=Lentilactobacillus farraginis DSM 18382 = JCM 14108 TaxID=1423743 RepID=X0QA74_9LACO|nr:hypothetical protein [Lentilactobacillus farraginis]KRM07437.1 hypothetical protein FD41_GL000394 [Lentilactobacillus farraginis DSM 18382 = JCM 14108]GAF35490.1 hypothetical protein JCM14108_378 [Lentilactobacillus farraginis DSM 18382 = JCM 14108]
MAHNVSHDEELLGILRDINEHRFHEGRQINPASMLFQTVQEADKKGYLEHAVIDSNPEKRLAEINLTHAILSTSGTRELARLSARQSH